MKSLFLWCCGLIGMQLSHAQSDYSIATLSDSLKQNANAVVRLDQTQVTISSQREMRVTYKRVVAVLNENGLSAIRGFEDYNKRKSIKDIHAVVYDAAGHEIKKIRRKDFRDVSTSGGNTFYSDDRVLYLDYTPVQYPFTMVYESEIQTSNTAFISAWTPVDDFFTAVEKSVFEITYPAALGLKKKEFNFAGFPITKSETSTQMVYTATSIPAQKPEPVCPAYGNLMPRVIFGLEHFNLEGVDGSAKTWEDFGKWYSQKILAGTQDLSEATLQKIRAMVGSETDPIKKARIIYDYVQQKSRYVAIMVGIGGWKPMPAQDVDRLGYGDCKALTNYTKALLDAVDVPSYYTIIYGDRNIRSIESDFVSMQGNHVILTIPNGDDNVWLECTSQDTPFGYQALFTDDRNALVIRPDGAQIVKTKRYPDVGNTQSSKGKYVISETGRFSGTIQMVTQGSQYRYELQSKPPTAREAYYKSYWSNINNLKIVQANFNNDKQNIAFTENLELQAENYGNLSGGRMMFAVNAFNQIGAVKRIRNRKYPFEVARGSYDVDEISIALPKGFAIEALPKDVSISCKYGEYQTKLVQSNDTEYLYKRTLLLKKGLYPSGEYDDFRQFMEQVSRNDNAKIVLIKI